MSNIKSTVLYQRLLSWLDPIMVASATHTVRRNAHASPLVTLNHALHSRSAKASCRATLTHICIPCTEAPLHDSVAARSCVRSAFSQTEFRWEPTSAIRPRNREGERLGTQTAAARDPQRSTLVAAGRAPATRPGILPFRLRQSAERCCRPH